MTFYALKTIKKDKQAHNPIMTLFYAFKNEKIWDHTICHPARANGKMSLNNQMASHVVKKNPQ